MSRPGDFTPAQRRQILARSEGRCVACGAVAVDADHMLALCLGGTGDLDNGRALCKPCHDIETAKQARARKKLRSYAGSNKKGSQWAGNNRHRGRLGSKQYRRKLNGEIVKR